MTISPEQHHEDCDYRVSHNAGDEAGCNLDCEATAMLLPHISEDELFLMIVGLEHLRDDNMAEAKRDRSHWIDQNYAEADAADYRAESVQAENLRQRLLASPTYP